MMWAAIALRAAGLVADLPDRPAAGARSTSSSSATTPTSATAWRASARTPRASRSIAASDDEERRLRAAFARIYATLAVDFMTYTKRLTWLTAFYGQAASVFPIVVAAPQYFAGEIQLGRADADRRRLRPRCRSALSWFIDSYAQLAAWKATLDRLTGLQRGHGQGQGGGGSEHAFDREHSPQPTPGCSRRRRRAAAQRPRAARGRRRDRPAGRAPCSCAAPRAAARPRCSACWRALAVRPRPRRRCRRTPACCFLPQKPYLPIGTLREVLSYPETPEHYTDEACREVLEACAAGRIWCRGCDESTNWSLILSGGEQQRLAFARALLYPARTGCSSTRPYSGARRGGGAAHVRAGARSACLDATVLSIAHRATAFAQHKRQLLVDGQAAARRGEKRVVAG